MGDAVDSGNTTTMKVASSMRIKMDPSSFFALLKLQITDPAQCRALGYDLDSDAHSDALTPAPITDVFRYKYTKNRSAETAIMYTGESHFLSLANGAVYVVTNALDSSQSALTIKTFTG